MNINLSKRQKQIFHCLSRGMSNKEIASEMEITEHTVKVHIWRLYKKIGANSRLHAIFLAKKYGFFDGLDIESLLRQMYYFLTSLNELKKDSTQNEIRKLLIAKYESMYHINLNKS